jgi:hypothetical protein
VLDKQERGVRGDGFEQQAANPGIALRAIDDDVEDHGFVNIVGEHARESGETAGLGIAEREDEIGMLDGAPDVLNLAAAAPPFGVVHVPKLLDLWATEPAGELESGN